jgi:hypothetical protein
MAKKPLMGQGVLIIEASRTLSETPHSVGLLWTNDELVAETSTWQLLHTHNRQTSMPPAWFEPAIPAGERQPTYALDRAANGISYFDCNRESS